MARACLILVLCSLLCLWVLNTTGIMLNELFGDPDVDRNASELITSKGYPLEEHTVQTADGYLLSVQRIPYGRKRNLQSGWDRTVLLIHGIFADTSNWILNNPEQSLGFILPDAGYDVWLLNTRGNRYSRKHVLYTTNHLQFWNFSFDEKARYDVPATVDYILELTGADDLCVIGHSEGTTATFAMLSEFPSYNNKVKLFIALAPVGTVGYITTIGRVLEPFAEELYFLLNVLFHGEVLPRNEMLRLFRAEICQFIAPEFCELGLFLTGGFDKQQLNQTRLDVYFANIPGISSAKSLYHCGQMIRSKRFRKFDYGPKNIEFYNQEQPPDYDVSRITTPTALFWTTNDKIADPTDVAFLRRNLNSLILDYQVPYPYNHFDFIIALNAAELIYKPILQLLSQY